MASKHLRGHEAFGAGGSRAEQLSVLPGASRALMAAQQELGLGPLLTFRLQSGWKFAAAAAGFVAQALSSPGIPGLWEATLPFLGHPFSPHSEFC